jgi:hypothetical protein
MSATVLGCGHTSHLGLFAIDTITKAPQIHLHYMTDTTEYEELGYGKIELCCHGCGASTLVYYKDDNTDDSRVAIKDEFVIAHEMCPDRRYDIQCPDWRSSFKVIDIRARKIRWFEKAVSMRRRPAKKSTGLVIPPPPPKMTRGRNGRTG